MTIDGLLNRCHCFQSLNFNIDLNFNKSGAVTGNFFFNNFDNENVEFKGLYIVTKDHILNLSFIIDYGLFYQTNKLMTAFYGDIDFSKLRDLCLKLSWLTLSSENKFYGGLEVNKLTYKGNAILHKYIDDSIKIKTHKAEPFFHYFLEVSSSIN